MAPMAAVALLIVSFNLPAPDAPLFVRVVDPSRLPLPGIEVRLIEVNNCGDLAPQRAEVKSHSSRDGQVEFRIEANHSYQVTTVAAGGLDSAGDCFDSAGNDLSPAYVELRPRPEPLQITLIQPSLVKPAPHVLNIFDLVGVYVNEKGHAYAVEGLKGDHGLRVSLPNGRDLFFTKPEGPLTFTGRDGTIRFERQGERVTRFSLTQPSIQAKRKRDD